MREIGSQRVTVFLKEEVNARVVTIILRGATNTLMDEAERALESGISAYKQLLRDGRFLLGAGAIECFLLNRLESYSGSLTGLEQYSCQGFGQAFETFARILVENAGLNPNECLPNLISGNANKPSMCVNVFQGKIESNVELKVYDHYLTKVNAIRLATHVALTVLKID